MLTLVKHAGNAKINFVTVEVCLPGVVEIIFPESWNFELYFFSIVFDEKMTSV